MAARRISDGFSSSWLKIFTKRTSDGKYLIFYNDNALWRMRWNGENLKKVFPWE